MANLWRSDRVMRTNFMNERWNPARSRYKHVTRHDNYESEAVRQLSDRTSPIKSPARLLGAWYRLDVVQAVEKPSKASSKVRFLAEAKKMGFGHRISV